MPSTSGVTDLDGTARLAARPFVNAFECAVIVGFKVLPWGRDHFTARNEHDVDVFQGFTRLKELSHETFRPISHDRVADLAAGGDAETRRTRLVRQGETGHEASAQANSTLIDASELRPPP